MVVGLLLRSVRVFGQFSWLEVSSVNTALSQPAHQRVTPAVSRLYAQNLELLFVCDLEFMKKKSLQQSTEQ